MEKRQITLRLPADLYERIKQEAERKNMPKQDLITTILWKILIENTAQG
ncbi:CopG family antitoxin [Enterococcus avium]|nr:CopG family antitoxin [Enterococcus avium]